MRAALGILVLTFGVADVVWINIDLIPHALAQGGPVVAAADHVPHADRDPAPPAPRVASLSPTTPPPRPAPPAEVVVRKAVARSPVSRKAVDPTPTPSPATDPAVRDVERFAPLLFPHTGSTRLSADAMLTLAAVAYAMAEQPTLEVDLRGHADRRGPPEVNLRLSRRRAHRARRQLRRLGVHNDRIRVESVGEAESSADAEAPHQWAQDRRVEIRLREGEQ